MSFDFLMLRSFGASLALHGIVLGGALGYGFGSDSQPPRIDFETGLTSISVSYETLGDSSPIHSEISSKLLPSLAQPKLEPILSSPAALLKTKSPPEPRMSELKTSSANPELQNQTKQSFNTNTELPNLSTDSKQLPTNNPGQISTGSPGPKGQLVRAPKPPFPYAARSAGFEGQVILDLLIDPTGHVNAADIIQSSGRTDCDTAAHETILKKWRFEPATMNGQPISWREKVVVVYNLR